MASNFTVSGADAMPASGGPYTITLSGNVTLSGPVSPILNSVAGLAANRSGLRGE